MANLDTAVVVAEREGLQHPMTVALPADEIGVYSVMGYAFNDPSREKTVHVDQYGGQVVSAYGFDDYPTLAKVVSQGIGLHEGRSLGLVSFWAAILMCSAVIFSCISGPLMWWRRPTEERLVDGRTSWADADQGLPDVGRRVGRSGVLPPAIRHLVGLGAPLRPVGAAADPAVDQLVRRGLAPLCFGSPVMGFRGAEGRPFCGGDSWKGYGPWGATAPQGPW